MSLCFLEAGLRQDCCKILAKIVTFFSQILESLLLSRLITISLSYSVRLSGRLGRGHVTFKSNLFFFPAARRTILPSIRSPSDMQ